MSGGNSNNTILVIGDGNYLLIDNSRSSGKDESTPTNTTTSTRDRSFLKIAKKSNQFYQSLPKPVKYNIHSQYYFFKYNRDYYNLFAYRISLFHNRYKSECGNTIFCSHSIRSYCFINFCFAFDFYLYVPNDSKPTF